MITEPTLELLLLQLFDVAASTDWAGWLGDARRFFGASAAGLVPLSAAPNRWIDGVTVGVPESRQAAYRDHFHLVDSWTQRIRAAPTGDPYSLEMLVPDRELYRSEFYNDYMRPAGRRYCVGVTVDVAGSQFLLAFSRGKTERDFDGDNLKALGRLSGFLKRAIHAQRLHQEADLNTLATQEVMNQASRGILILDSSLRVAFANKVGADHAAAEDVIGIRNGQVVAMNRSDEGKFRTALEEAAAPSGHQSILRLVGAKTETQMTAAVMSVSGSSPPILDLGIARPAVLLILSGHADQAAFSPAHLESVFGFTAQEARTASLLVSGLDLNEVAQRLSIGRETVRYHLKGIFSKTSTHSQRELVHFITASLPAVPLNGQDSGRNR